MDWRERIVQDPEVRFGKPVVKHTRIAVTDVLGWLGAGMTEKDILEEYPQLKLEDIRACLNYAAERDLKPVSLRA